eukprot:TRINITY_DN17291_c0_g2_i1.p4 TRINITY_DN17291_c0_g2~~TRINITY_DN17291_c0_g2_i1.p4  ORF type:complete len:141 (+),score=0.07 TRINITY_DN17291_c0_g2_i1:578-1000(+)
MIKQTSNSKHFLESYHSVKEQRRQRVLIAKVIFFILFSLCKFYFILDILKGRPRFAWNNTQKKLQKCFSSVQGYKGSVQQYSNLFSLLFGVLVFFNLFFESIYSEVVLLVQYHSILRYFKGKDAALNCTSSVWISVREFR